MEESNSINLSDLNQASSSDLDYSVGSSTRKPIKKKFPKEWHRSNVDQLSNFEGSRVEEDIFQNVLSFVPSTPKLPHVNVTSQNQLVASGVSPSIHSADEFSNLKEFQRERDLFPSSPSASSKEPSKTSLEVDRSSIRGATDWIISRSYSGDDSTGRKQKYSVEGAIVSSSDDETEAHNFDILTSRDNKKGSSSKERTSFCDRMLSAMKDLEQTMEISKGIENSSLIVEPSIELLPPVCSAASRLLSALEESSNKSIFDQPTDPLSDEDKTLPDRQVCDDDRIYECDTEPPSNLDTDDSENDNSPCLPESSKLGISDQPTIELFDGPSSSSAPNLKDVKTELASSEEQFFDCPGEVVDVIDLLDSSSFVELISSSDSDNCSSQTPTKFVSSVAAPKPTETAPSKQLLMDVVLKECSKYAGAALSENPLKSFHDHYSCLSSTAKDVFNEFLIPSLENDVRWFRCTNSLVANELVEKDIFVFMDDQDDFFSRVVILLNASELFSVFSKLDPHFNLKTEGLRIHLLEELSNCTQPKCANGSAKLITTTMFSSRFMKMNPQALLASKMALDIFALPLNLFEKTYKFGDIARYLNSFLVELACGQKRLLHLTQAEPCSLISSTTDFSLFVDSFALKKNFILPKYVRERLPGLQNMSELCAELAVLFYGPSHPVKTTPLFAYQVSNLIRMLDEKIYQVHSDDDEVIKLKYCCVSILLKQETTHVSQKGLWAKKYTQLLSKLMGFRCDPDQLREILLENVSPFEQYVRSNFVSQILSSKRKGLTLNEKRELASLLKTTSFKKQLLKFRPEVGDRKGDNKYSARQEEYYRKKFSNVIVNSGSLLINAIFLIFWPIIYLDVDGVFVSDYQKVPTDWGGVEFYENRKEPLAAYINNLQQRDTNSLIELVNTHIKQFMKYHCVVDWAMLHRKDEMFALLKELGAKNFLLLSNYVLEKVSERKIGFPEITCWNNGSKIRFAGLRNPSDPLYFHQVVWLDKLHEFGIDVEECQIALTR